MIQYTEGKRDIHKEREVINRERERVEEEIH